MRFLLVVAFLALVAAVFAGDAATCRGKNRNVFAAINFFCGTTENMVVPSVKSRAGYYHNGVATARIQGTCSPPQWVPRKYCLSQFWNMCARGSAKGQNLRYYGKNGCQKWILGSA